MKKSLLDGLHAVEFSSLNGAYLPISALKILLEYTKEILKDEELLDDGIVINRIAIDGADDIFKLTSHAQSYEVISLNR